MHTAPTSLVPMAHVHDLRRSLAFYRHLGFEVRNTYTPDDGDAPVWAYLEAGKAHLMLTLADEPVDAARQAVLFYLYFENIADAHAALTAKGMKVGPLSYPQHAPDGEFSLQDLDGYCLMCTHT